MVRSDIPVESVVRVPDDLPPHVETAVYFVVAVLGFIVGDGEAIVGLIPVIMVYRSLRRISYERA